MNLTFPRFGLLFFLMAVAMATVALPRAVNVPLSAHAIERHGADAETASACLDGRDRLEFFNPSLNRYGVAYWLGDRWGIVILCAATLGVVTSWVTKRLKTPEKLTAYMGRQGYAPSRRH